MSLHDEIENTDKGIIRVGKSYQAICPELNRSPRSLKEKEILVWRPSEDIPDEKYDFIARARDKYNYNDEQALGMLFWHKYDIEKALHDLTNFSPLHDQWSAEDKSQFKEAFKVHGKNLNNIKTMLPNKTVGSIVRYYYMWKRSHAGLTMRNKNLRKTDPLESSSKPDNNSETRSVEELQDVEMS